MLHAPEVRNDRRGRRVQKPYPAEYRARMVELVRSGRSPESLEKEFGVTAPTIRS
jgi:transposase